MNGDLAILPSAKRVRVTAGGETVADSTRTLLLLEVGAFPIYYFPPEDVRTDLLQPSGKRGACARKGEASWRKLVTGRARIEDFSWVYEAPSPAAAALAGRIAFDWHKAERWREEEEELVGHVRDPFHRVDTRLSTRRVRVVAGGETVADTRRAVFLFETGIRTRYYIPREDVAMRHLEPSATRTACPYKGWASYWSVTAGGRRFADVVWCYEDPLPESRQIGGFLAFWDEKVDAVLVDER